MNIENNTMTKLTQSQIKELFIYKNGFLYWKVNKCNNKIKSGDKAGGLNQSGYYRVKINSKSYRSHRLIFLYHHDYLPEFIDHIDGDKSNNRIENLREITNSQNQMNSKLRKNTSSKYKGVRLKGKKWESQIRFNGKLKYLGMFIDEKSAALAYNKVAIKYFGEYAKLNEVE